MAAAVARPNTARAQFNGSAPPMARPADPAEHEATVLRAAPARPRTRFLSVLLRALSAFCA